MEFLVTRTWSRTEKPCENVYEKVYTREIIIKTDDIGFSEYFWYSKGTGHKINGKYATRYDEEKAWYITLDTIEDLLKFISDNGGRVVIEPDSWDMNSTKIEIYDDYRE